MSTNAASKAAVVRLSENLAVEAGEHGISAFAICPEVVRTAMSEAVAGSGVFGSVRKLLDEGKSHPPAPAQTRSFTLIPFPLDGPATLIRHGRAKSA
jgi:NAD(P)-dependent dehydrogenase (short-subunit alcohol dehydrogenase family)